MAARQSLSLSVRLRLWAFALFLVSFSVHAIDLSTPGLLDRTGRLKASDYMRLYVTGVLARDGRWSEFFDPDAHVRTAQANIAPTLQMYGLHPNYSPAAGIALAPLTHLPFLPSLYVFSAISIAAYAIAVTLVTRASRHLWSDWVTVAVSAAAFPALFNVLRYGQLSAITLLLFAAAAVSWAANRRFLAGLVLGLVVYKPNLLVGPAIVVIAAGEWPVAIGLCAGAAIETALGFAVSNRDTMLQYVTVLLTLAKDPGVIQIHPAELHSWRGFFWLLLPAGTAGLLTLLAGLATLVLAVIAFRRSDDWRIRWAVLTLTAMLTSPHLLTYDLLLLGLPLTLAVDCLADAPASVTRFTWIGMLLAYFSVIISPVLANVTHLQLSTLTMAWLLAYCTFSLTPQGGASHARVD